MITLLVYFVVICVVLYGIKSLVPMPPPMDKVFYFACILIALGFFVYALQAFGVMGPLPRLR
jgi:hypothetical protein